MVATARLAVVSCAVALLVMVLAFRQGSRGRMASRPNLCRVFRRAVMMKLRTNRPVHYRRPPRHGDGQAKQQCQKNPEFAHRFEVSPISRQAAICASFRSRDRNAASRRSERALRLIPVSSLGGHLHWQLAGTHLQQAQFTHLQSWHLQHAQALFSIVAAFITFSMGTAGCRGVEVEP